MKVPNFLKWQCIQLKLLKIWHNYLRGSTVYAILFLSGLAVWFTLAKNIAKDSQNSYTWGWDNARIGFISDPYTLGWFLALFFPFIAVFFIISSLKVRLSEILDLFDRDKLWFVYEEPGDDDTAEGARYRFSKFLWKRLDDYYDLHEFLAFSLLAGATTFLVYAIILVQFNLQEKPPLSLDAPSWALFGGSAFLGSLSGSFVFILRRYRMFDLRPLNFLHVSVALVAGTCSGAFMSLAAYSAKTPYVPMLLTFVVGFLASVNIEFLPQLMRKQFAWLTSTQLPKEIEYDLSSVIQNAEVIENLNSISIFSVRELACADPILLYLNMPQQIEIINGMVDQAIFHFYFSEIKSDLERVNIRRFTQLLLVLGASFSDNAVNWPQSVSVLDDGGQKDAMLLKAARAVISDRRHHRVLGLLLEEYRRAFFIQDKSSGSDLQFT